MKGRIEHAQAMFIRKGLRRRIANFENLIRKDTFAKDAETSEALKRCKTSLVKFINNI